MTKEEKDDLRFKNRMKFSCFRDAYTRGIEKGRELREAARISVQNTAYENELKCLKDVVELRYKDGYKQALSDMALMCIHSYYDDIEVDESEILRIERSLKNRIDKNEE